MDEEIVAAFAACMTDDSSAKMFVNWGQIWATKWKRDFAYLAPEQRNRPYIEFVRTLQEYCDGQPWEQQAKSLWNEKYADRLFGASA